MNPTDGDAPFALALRIVPWHVDVFRLYGAAFTREVLCDLLQELVQLRLIDDGDTVDDKNVVKALIILDLISTRAVRILRRRLGV